MSVVLVVEYCLANKANCAGYAVLAEQYVCFDKFVCSFGIHRQTERDEGLAR